MAIGHHRSDEPVLDAAGLGGLPEAGLVERAKQHDREAFAEIYRRHSDQILRLARSRLPDARAAEEIVQETFLRGLGRIRSFDSSRPLGPWLATIAANLVVDWHRSRDRLVPTDCADEVVRPPSGADPTLDAVLAAEGVRKLRTAIDRLPTRQRRILLASTIEELSPAVVAMRENVSEASVTSVVYRARRAVRRSLRRLGLVLVAVRFGRDRTRAEAFSLPAAEAALSGVALSLVLIVGSPPPRFVDRPAAPAPRYASVPAQLPSRSSPAVAPRPARRDAVASDDGVGAPVRAAMETKPPRDGSPTPSGGRVRIDVIGPNGGTLHYEEFFFECDERVPEQSSGPVRVVC